MKKITFGFWWRAAVFVTGVTVLAVGAVVELPHPLAGLDVIFLSVALLVLGFALWMEIKTGQWREY